MEKGNHHSKKLKDIEKKEMFQAPEGYFDQLPGRVLERIAAQEKKQTHAKIIPFKSWWWAVAAATLLVVSTFIIISNSRTEATSTDYYALLNGVSSEEIVTYLGETDISIAELEMALASDEGINMYDSNSIPDIEEKEEAEALLEYYSL
ncbi:hypothetical protein GCM10011506_27200 [Marivirga lumbricoides]|uniref:DUF3379 domain-containing protein n=1 Tax=Marivirga lumbricoides TaxID=1046115 RepID=A0ABQ1MGA7_9BACT|nr:hypothetical protein GCM10011506_27200 [Marivirga lumbricoides]